MPDQSLREAYTVRDVPFDEWADIDTLVHRAALSSGDFDYVLRPVCPDCGSLLEMDYDEVAEGASQLAEVICHSCRVSWQLADDESA